ncbi:MAG: glycosyltransferase [Gemmatimonadota bacterium]|nr:glycosyltransferase [Gemmatimonadota bacterium]
MTPDPLLILAAATLLIFAAAAAELGRGQRLLVALRTVPAIDDADAPSLSVVIAARDEARNIEAALRSVLAQAYPRLEVVVVDDRSTDGTGEILDRVAREDGRLRVIHVRELPPGWLGKNHALQRGAEAAGGELILFTDADVVLDPTALARAVRYLRERGLDHLTAAPDVRMPGWLLQSFAVAFSVFFALFARPWRARDPDSRAHVGIGAFNLLRADAYRAMEMHAPIRMRVDDDMKLGKLVKTHRLRQDFVVGHGMLSVEWYASLAELVRGLTKNAFAAVDFRVSVVVVATVGQIACFLWPFLAVWILDGPARWLNAAAVVFLLALYAGTARLQGGRPVLAVTFPVAVLLFLFILWRSTLLTLLRGGVEWRGTHYPLAELRAGGG